VNPNRMELMRLKRRHLVAIRGHKLLKDKLEELLKEFLARIAECRKLRVAVESELANVYGLHLIARAESGPGVIGHALANATPKELIDYSEHNIMNVTVPRFSLAERPIPCCYSYLITPAVLDSALDALSACVPRLIELAEKEKVIEILAVDIERTRRRVNALEHVLIPQIAYTVREITNKLEEAARSDLVRLMKVKEMIVD